jgi:hypothetical protein
MRVGISKIAEIDFLGGQQSLVTRRPARNNVQRRQRKASKKLGRIRQFLRS